MSAQPVDVLAVMKEAAEDVVSGDVGLRLLRAAESVAELIASHKVLLDTAERLDLTEGYCCCGDDMQRHADPMSCGHEPVDAGSYYHGQAVDRARAALARCGGRP